jgi:hypothetical protein
MAIVSFSMMLLSLIIQGAYFWARDAVTPNLPVQFLISDVVWAASLCSLAIYGKFPWVTVICSWGLLLTVTVFLRKFYFSHTFASTLLMSSAATANVFFAHYGVWIRRRGNRRLDGPTVKTTP